jgi:hypothetical protein
MRHPQSSDWVGNPYCWPIGDGLVPLRAVGRADRRLFDMAAARGILALGHADYLFWVAGVSRHPGAVLLSLLWHGMGSGGGACPAFARRWGRASSGPVRPPVATGRTR